MCDLFFSTTSAQNILFAPTNTWWVTLEIGAETREGWVWNYSSSISPQNRMRSAIRQLYTWTKHTQRYGEYKGWIFPTSCFKHSHMENGGKHESDKMNVTSVCLKINFLLQDRTFGHPTNEPTSERTNERQNKRTTERTNQPNNKSPTSISNKSPTRCNNFSSLLSWRLFTAQYVSGNLTPIIRSSTTAVAASGFIFGAWW